MHGNLMEWCLDAFQPYEKVPPASVTDPVVPPHEGTRLLVARGGEWWRGPDGCSSESRYEKENVSSTYRGFRVVLAPIVGN